MPRTAPVPLTADPPRVIAWNDLGMHCIDPDFSVFSILPPFNTINTQVILNGQLQTQAGNLTVTYESVADATGSINTTSIGKTNFWSHVQSLFSVNPPPDVGLTGNAMPGLGNLPQPMHFDAGLDWWQGEGIPITPIDDAQQENPYPLMRVVVRDAAGQEITSTVTTVPNSQELSCSLCHKSGGSSYARPFAGWEFDPDPLRDDRLNILRLHDDFHLGTQLYTAALVAAGYDSAGLYETATTHGTSILCARCHGTNALPGTGLPSIKPLTEAIHGRHAWVTDPSGTYLNDDPTRNSCYTCHPGFDTKCLRGAMGKAIDEHGEYAMQCQDCHGSMSDVGEPGRVGWLDQPTCQNCHTGSALVNSGQIRYETVFDNQGNRRTPASNLFATDPDVPQTGFSLYRFSTGHGDLQCSACHGPPHAIYPTSEDNDNAQSMALQGDIGTITDCNVCHDGRSEHQVNGPHGMHPVDLDWVTDTHGDIAEHGNHLQCRACHGTDYRGTELSYAQGNRMFATQFGVKNFWRGFRVGCYDCHDGPTSDDPIANRPPVVAAVTRSTPNDVPLQLTLTGQDPNGNTLTFRIVSQPKHGKVAISGANVTYTADPGYLGTDIFTYAARDGFTDSNLGRVTVSVNAPQCAGSAERYGFGSPGSGGELPQLSLDGCPTPGGTITLHVDQGLGGAAAVLVMGRDRANVELAPGNMLRVGPSPAVVSLPGLSGSGAGNGSTQLQIPIPANARAGTFTFQAFLLDSGAQWGWNHTNGLQVDVR